MTAIPLGEGVLNWRATERVSDRYGAVHLAPGPFGDPVPFAETSGVLGQSGTLSAQVLATRESSHIGDLFRGLRPSTPEVGDILTLGTGILFVERGTELGVLPADGRDADWLDPEALYRCHNQTVRLLWEPVP